MAAILIQCVVVLYKQDPGQARSLVSLLEICDDDPAIASRIRITVHDNSPDPPVPESWADSNIDYFHSPDNPGLAAAYNRALSLARTRDIPWLLTLDQDTEVNRNFFLQLLAALESDLAKKVCAFVPELVNSGVVLSPQIVGSVLYHRLPLKFCGFSDKPLVAFNSASCLNVMALAGIGGFPEEYWLDYLDHIVFYRLQAAGGRVYVVDAQLQHSLSMQFIEAEVSLSRYANVLAGEWRFVRDTSSFKGRQIHRMRLLKRTVMHAIRLRNKEYARVTLRAALQLRFPRSGRLDPQSSNSAGN